MKQWRKLAHAINQDLFGSSFRLFAAYLILAPFPRFVGNRTRGLVLRALGFNIGRGTMFSDMLTIVGPRDAIGRIRIGEHCFFNIGCVFDVGAEIVVGCRVSFGHQVLVITSSHEIGSQARRAGSLVSAPVVIGDGAWIASRVTILPGVTIGAGSIIGAGSVVTRSVPANTVAVGQPARVIRHLKDDLDAMIGGESA